MKRGRHDLVDLRTLQTHLSDKYLNQVEGLEAETSALVAHFLAEAVVDSHDQLVVDVAVQKHVPPKFTVRSILLECLCVQLGHCDHRFHRALTNPHLAVPQKLH